MPYSIFRRESMLACLKAIARRPLTWIIVFFACPLAPFSSISLANEEEAAVSQSAAEAVSDVPGQLTAIPGESGFSGSVILGASYNWLKSNMIAGNDFGDVGRERIDSILDEPDAESDVVPAVSVDLRYTFAESGTQLFLGNRLEDLLRYDLTLTAFWHEPFGWRDWSLLGSAAYAKSNSNIDFYDKVGFIGTGGVLYRF
jgi:hypothetical protein